MPVRGPPRRATCHCQTDQREVRRSVLGGHPISDPECVLPVWPVPYATSCSSLSKRARSAPYRPHSPRLDRRQTQQEAMEQIHRAHRLQARYPGLPSSHPTSSSHYSHHRAPLRSRMQPQIPDEGLVASGLRPADSTARRAGGSARSRRPPLHRVVVAMSSADDALGSHLASRAERSSCDIAGSSNMTSKPPWLRSSAGSIRAAVTLARTTTRDGRRRIARRSAIATWCSVGYDVLKASDEGVASEGDARASRLSSLMRITDGARSAARANALLIAWSRRPVSDAARSVAQRSRTTRTPEDDRNDEPSFARKRCLPLPGGPQRARGHTASLQPREIRPRQGRHCRCWGRRAG